MAIKTAKQKKLSLRKIANCYGIPSSTLWSHVKGQFRNCPKLEKKKSNILTEKKEKAIVEYLQYKARNGMALRKCEVSKAFLVGISM